MDIHVHEFAVLDDGRRLTLPQHRGFSMSATDLTAEHAESSVLTTVLPDDAEVAGEDHPWEWLASLIQNHGWRSSAGGVDGRHWRSWQA